MKKIAYLLGLVLLASCGDADKFDEWAQPLSNAQEAAKSISLTATAAPVVNFETVGQDSVVLCTPVLTADDEIGKETYTITLYNADKTASQKLNSDKNGRVKALELQTAVEGLYGKAGDLRKIPATITDQVLLLRGEAFTLKADFEAQVKLIAPSFAEFIYEIGNEGNWKTVQYLRSKEQDGNYLGYCFLNGEFKFRSNETAWDGPDWEYGGTEGSLSENGVGNFPDPGKGFYKVEASLANGTLKLTKVETISIIGSVLDKDWKIDGDMTFNEADKSWTWTGHLDAGEMKFRVNHDWAISWGGANDNEKAFDNLTENGGKNLKIDEAGEYTVKLFITYEGNNRVEILK
ncbi:DUF5115 domain-containing protein [Prevotella dentasini]